MKKQKVMKEIDNQLYRRLMYQYFRKNEWPYASSITYVKVFKQKDEITIEIETHRPGLLIGKAGKFFDGLQNFIAKETKENIKYIIKECELWLNLYTNKKL